MPPLLKDARRRRRAAGAGGGAESSEHVTRTINESVQGGAMHAGAFSPTHNKGKLYKN